MTPALKAAMERLDKAAIVIGSMLIDGPDPKHGDVHELEAACVAYVEALRDGDPRNATIDFALKDKLIDLDGRKR